MFSLQTLKDTSLKLLKKKKKNDGFILSSNHEDVSENMDQDDLVSFQMMTIIASNSNGLFTSHEMKEETRQSTHPTIEVHDVWVLCESHQQYSSCDKLYIGEFDKLTLQVVPTIQVHAKSTMRISYFIFISNFRLGLIFRVYI